MPCIARHFRPLAGPGALDLLDDAALLAPPAGRELVLTVDAMVGGVHFLPDDPPDLVARKLLRMNLSDLAAKGAVPLGYLMTVSAPRGHAGGVVRRLRRRAGAGPGGIRRHAAGRRHHVDARAGQPVTDHPRPCRARRGGAPRAGARAGDAVCVTGTIGDGALGLLAARGELADPDWLSARPLPAATARGSASRGRGSSTPRWMSPTGWCRTSAISAAPRPRRRDRGRAVPLSAGGARGRRRPVCQRMPDRRR